jgi:hypothetical protein
LTPSQDLNTHIDHKPSVAITRNIKAEYNP